MTKNEFRASLMSKIGIQRNKIRSMESEQFDGDQLKYLLDTHEAIKISEGIIEGLKTAWQMAELLDEQQTITEQLKQKLFGGTNEN